MSINDIQYIYDSKTKSLEEFRPVEDGKVSFYVCGPTVQAGPHIGHLRSAVVFDVVRRWFDHLGYETVYIQNITNIDDKIINKANDNGIEWWRVATENERLFNKAYEKLNILPPSIQPRATDHITQIIDYIERIIDNGYAYVGSDNSVYFDLVSWMSTVGNNTATVSGNVLDNDIDEDLSGNVAKRHRQDFALWKSQKPGEPAWNSPWGKGRPGWHIEDTAIATYYLGEVFDIHGGGIDLKFPHHDAEQFQAYAAGDEFSRYWMHNHWVTLKGEKMSKSLGNTVSAENLLDIVRPIDLRYYLMTAQYSSVLEYSESSLIDASKSMKGIEEFFKKVLRKYGTIQVGDIPEEFRSAMLHDFNTPVALSVIHEMMKNGNIALDNNDDAALFYAQQVRAMLSVLGVDPLSESWGMKISDDVNMEKLDSVVSGMLQDREQARKNKDWSVADSIRDTLTQAGIVIIDTPNGPHWEFA